MEVGVRFGEGFAPGDEDYVVLVVAVEMARLRAAAADAMGGGLMGDAAGTAGRAGRGGRTAAFPVKLLTAQGCFAGRAALHKLADGIRIRRQQRLRPRGGWTFRTGPD